MGIPTPDTPAGPLTPRRSLPVRFLLDRRGEMAIEYGLIASLIVVAILAALSQFSGATNKLYNKISNAMQGSP